jgi:hypothetical protein
MSQLEIKMSTTPAVLGPVCHVNTTNVSKLTYTTDISGVCAKMKSTLLSVMIMGEVIHNIALFVQLQEHTKVQEQN